MSDSIIKVKFHLRISYCSLKYLPAFSSMDHCLFQPFKTFSQESLASKLLDQICNLTYLNANSLFLFLNMTQNILLK